MRKLFFARSFWFIVVWLGPGWAAPGIGGDAVAQTGFRIRGTKGWAWTADQYLAELPVLAEYRMNFLMNCYLSMYDIEHQPWHSGKANRWWQRLPEAKKRAYQQVVRRCRQHRIDWCFCMNPNFKSPRALDYDSQQDFENLWQHYAWMQGLGVKWFCVSLDDITRGIDPKGQSRLLNKLLKRLRAGDPAAQLITTLPYYWGTGEGHRGFLETVAAELHPDVYVFWTGNSVVPAQITRAAAEKYKSLVGHRLIIWENYPVNNGTPTLHLGPVTGREADLCTVVDGYMANPLCPQNEINRLPLYTLADYARNPSAYDPERSIGRAIQHLGKTAGQREVLKELVGLYPGKLRYGKPSSFNPLLDRFEKLMKTKSASEADLLLRHVEEVAQRLEAEFPRRFAATKRTLRQNLKTLKQMRTRKQRVASGLE